MSSFIRMRPKVRGYKATRETGNGSSTNVHAALPACLAAIGDHFGEFVQEFYHMYIRKLMKTLRHEPDMGNAGENDVSVLGSINLSSSAASVSISHKNPPPSSTSFLESSHQLLHALSSSFGLR